MLGLGVLDTVVTLLGRSWNALGRSWGALGALLGCSWGHAGPILPKNPKNHEKTTKFGLNLGGKMEPKSLKIDVKSQHVFRHVFFTIFFDFSLILEVEFQWFFDGFLDLKRKRRFCKNWAPVQAGARFLRFRRKKNHQKINQKSMQNKSEKMIGKFQQKYQFWDGFGKGFGRVWEGLEGIKIRWKKDVKIRGPGTQVQ